MFLEDRVFWILSNTHFGEHRIALNNYIRVYDIYDGGLPGDLMMLLFV